MSSSDAVHMDVTFMGDALIREVGPRGHIQANDPLGSTVTYSAPPRITQHQMYKN